MDSGFYRTSVTEDEAVAILLGWSNGPFVFRARSEELSEDEQEAHDSLVFTLREYLLDEMELLESDLAEAKAEKLPSNIIEEKYEAVQRYAEVKEKAKKYLCDIADELNKGEASALRQDVTLSKGTYIYITLTSLDEWVKSKGYGVEVLVPVQIAIPSETELPKVKEKKVRRKLRDQEVAIVEEIKRLGHNPLELPNNIPGKSGLKAEVRKSLANDSLFQEGTTVFNKAWERVKKDIAAGIVK